VSEQSREPAKAVNVEEKAKQPSAKPRPPRRSLADLVPPAHTGDSPTALQQNPANAAPTFSIQGLEGTGRATAAAAPQVDADRVAAAGLRKLEGRHLTLYTDVPSQPEVDELPAVFDQAVPQWAAYFNLPEERWRNWRIVGSLIQAKERFERAGLMLDGLPPFTQGFQAGLQIWLHEQSTPYYRRHLLLHEGTHAVMNTLLGGSGPPWYGEGVSELLATHRWQEGRLTLRTLAQHRDEAPGWGRIKIIRDDFTADRGKVLDEVMRYGPDAHLQVEPYGWCWAACFFLDAHPKTQAAFRALRSDVRDTSHDFSRRFLYELRGDWADVAEDWQVFLANADYGYDLARNLVERKSGEPLPDNGAKVTIKVDRGWQSTGWQLEANRAYEFVARGRYRIVAEPEECQAEPGGITLRYHKGLPLGMLLGAIRPDLIPANKLTPLATPDEIGLGRRAVMEHTGTLYLRVNDAPGELADNQGELVVEIRSVRLPN